MKAAWAHTCEQHQNTGQSGASTVWGYFCYVSAKLCFRAKAKGPREFFLQNKLWLHMELFAMHTYISWEYMVSASLRQKHSEGLDQSKPFSVKKWSDSRVSKEKATLRTSALFNCPGDWGTAVREWVRKRQREVSMALWQKLYTYKAVTGLLSTKESSLTPHRYSKTEQARAANRTQNVQKSSIWFRKLKKKGWLC